MAAPRRALASSLTRIAASMSGKLNATNGLPALVATQTQLRCCERAQPYTSAAIGRALKRAARELPTLGRYRTRYLTTGRPISSNDWKFADVKAQVEANKELADTDSDQKVVFVDVREPHELHNTGKIPGAINVPITTVAQSFHISDEDFEDLYGFARPAKDVPLVFYCKAGVRAKGAAALAKHAGWEDVGEYPGSWLDWEAGEGPVEPVKKPISPV